LVEFGFYCNNDYNNLGSVRLSLVLVWVSVPKAVLEIVVPEVKYGLPNNKLHNHQKSIPSEKNGSEGT
jgi:hypothetical protein